MAKVGVYLTTDTNEHFSLITECDTTDIGEVIDSLSVYGLIDEDGTEYKNVVNRAYIVGSDEVFFGIYMSNEDAEVS